MPGALWMPLFFSIFFAHGGLANPPIYTVWLGYVYPSRAGLINSNLSSVKKFAL